MTPAPSAAPAQNAALAPLPGVDMRVFGAWVASSTAALRQTDTMAKTLHDSAPAAAAPAPAPAVTTAAPAAATTTLVPLPGVDMEAFGAWVETSTAALRQTDQMAKALHDAGPAFVGVEASAPVPVEIDVTPEFSFAAFGPLGTLDSLDLGVSAPIDVLHGG
ncbi:hypothetical protein [Azospirillum argentinense]|uniref:Uncharacterized protein n=1 Tax=Azospirillum brasilense TaxID=192 RepID=A0A4D8QAY6_AZOBR|nr:hypothetical protein [Azospirillum argentinense]QCO07468.1 hypothetical protein D3867_36915 [Azospirillum argentinense]